MNTSTPNITPCIDIKINLEKYHREVEKSQPQNFFGGVSVLYENGSVKKGEEERESRKELESEKKKRPGGSLLVLGRIGSI